MVFSPDRLSSRLNVTAGVAKPCHYLVLIAPPVSLGPLGFIATEHLSIMAEDAEIPGRQFLTTDFIMYGTNVKMPYGVAYDDFNVTFIATGAMVERHFFDAWQTIISDPLNNYFNYYDNYVTNITVIKFADDGTPTYVTTIEEAYPVAIEAQKLSYDSNDYMRLTIKFAYRRWRSLIDKLVGGGLGVPNPDQNIAELFPDGFGNVNTDSFGEVKDLLGKFSTEIKRVQQSIFSAGASVIKSI